MNNNHMVGAKNFSPLQESTRPNRQSIRLQGYDYSRAGAYAVTICTHNRDCLFGEITDGQMRLNDGGRTVEWVWGELPVRFDYIDLDEFVVMPNHVHGIFVIHRRGEPCVRPDIVHDCKSGLHQPGQKHLGEYKIRPYNGSGSTGDKTMGEHKVRPNGTLPDTVGRIVQAFKSITTHKYITGVKQYGWPPFPGKLWQRNYYERIICDEDELKRMREYIINNPMKWDLDRENPLVGAKNLSPRQIDVGGGP
ncbi:MAG: transposase [Desulfobacterales bacterium]